jgi:glycosyltransferase involved in cell wall biosynthesis
MTTRILQIIPTLVRGGAEKQLTLLATGLPGEEFDVHVAVLTEQGPYLDTLRDQGIPVHLIEKRWKLDPAAYRRLKQHIRRLKPDIVQTWIFAANCYGRQAALAAGVPHIVGSERCVDRWKAWHELALDRYYARRSQRLVVNSAGVRDFYTQHGIAAAKFAVIPNGIDSFRTDGGVSREGLLEELGLPADARLIGAVGRLWPQKRYKDLIWCAELLRAGRGDTHLLIAGEGPQRGRLEKFSRQILVNRHVHFLGHRDDIRQLMPLWDCFWLGSGYEGQSNALMEAMACGLPVVATDIPGNRDLVIPDETGFLVPVGDCAQMSRKTQRLLNEPELAREFGQRAQQRMRDEFSVAKMVERYAAFYRELMV